MYQLTQNFYFFQAEDGIRYRDVTGVQTCALPISARRLPRRAARRPPTRPRPLARRPPPPRPPPRLPRPTRPPRAPGRQIGRASCRERVEVLLGATSVR